MSKKLRLMKETSIAAKISYAILTFLALAMIYTGALLFMPYDPGTVDVPIKIQDTSVTKGEPIILLLSSCTNINTKVDLQVEVLFNGGSDIALPVFRLTDIPTEKGCITNSPFPIDLSNTNLQLPSGQYRIRLRTTYVVNSLRTHKVNYDSVLFNYISEE